MWRNKKSVKRILKYVRKSMIYRIDVAMKAVSKILRRLVLRVKNNRVIKINIFKTRIYCSL